VIDFKWRQLHLVVTEDMLFRIMRHLRREYKSYLGEIREELCKKFSIDFTPYKEKGIFATPVFNKLSTMDKIYGGDIFLGEKMEQYYLQVRQDRKCLDAICMGRIGEVTKEFDQFCEIITQAIFPVVKSDHHLTWKEFLPISPKYNLLKNDIAVFAPNQEDYRAVGDLESVKSRELINKIKAKPSVNLSELADENERLIIGSLVQKMEQLGLVNIDYIVYCHQTGQQINRVSSYSSIEEAAHQGFKCFQCGRLVSQEKIDQCISITSYGNYITRGSYWLSVRLLGILKSSGLYGEEILIDYPEGDIDIINQYFNCDNSLVMVEIKAEAYNMRDAYLFYNKINIYKPDNVILISINPIKQGIKDYFKQVLPDINILYIDSLMDLPQILSLFLEQKRNEYIWNLLRNFVSFTYTDFASLAIASFYGLEPETTEDEEIEEIIKIQPEEEKLVRDELIEDELIPEELMGSEPVDDDILSDDILSDDLLGEDLLKDMLTDYAKITEEIKIIPEKDLREVSDISEVDILEGTSSEEDMMLTSEEELMMTEDTDMEGFDFKDAIDFLGEGLDDFTMDEISLEEPAENTSSDILRQITGQEIIDNLTREGFSGKSIASIRDTLNSLDDLEGGEGSTIANNEGLLICGTLKQEEKAEILSATSVEINRRINRAFPVMDISKPGNILLETLDKKILIFSSDEFVLATLIKDKLEDCEDKIKNRLAEFLKKVNRKNAESSIENVLKLLSENENISGGIIGTEEGLLIMSNLPGNFSSENWIAYLVFIYQSAEDTIERMNIGNLKRYIFKSQVDGKEVNIISLKNGGIILGALIQEGIPIQKVNVDLNAALQAVNDILGI